MATYTNPAPMMAQMAYFFLCGIWTFQRYQMGVEEYTKSVKAVRPVPKNQFAPQILRKTPTKEDICRIKKVL